MRDADAIAREVVEPGTPALARLAERFGADVVGPDGRLDRPRLAARAFVTEADRWQTGGGGLELKRFHVRDGELPDPML